MAKTMTRASTQGDHLWPCGHVFIKPLLLCGMQGEMDEIYGGADNKAVVDPLAGLDVGGRWWWWELWTICRTGGGLDCASQRSRRSTVDEEPVEAMTWRPRRLYRMSVKVACSSQVSSRMSLIDGGRLRMIGRNAAISKEAIQNNHVTPTRRKTWNKESCRNRLWICYSRVTWGSSPWKRWVIWILWHKDGQYWSWRKNVVKCNAGFGGGSTGGFTTRPVALDVNIPNSDHLDPSQLNHQDTLAALCLHSLLLATPANWKAANTQQHLTVDVSRLLGQDVGRILLIWVLHSFFWKQKEKGKQHLICKAAMGGKAKTTWYYDDSTLQIFNHFNELAGVLRLLDINS